MHSMRSTMAASTVRPGPIVACICMVAPSASLVARQNTSRVPTRVAYSMPSTMIVLRRTAGSLAAETPRRYGIHPIHRNEAAPGDDHSVGLPSAHIMGQLT
jgi:hypothetical protein